MCGKSKKGLKFWAGAAGAYRFKCWLNLAVAAMKLLALSGGLAYILYFGSSGSYKVIYC